MTGQWMIWLLVTGFTFVSGNNCDTAPAEKCYTDLVRYEGSTFPLYGQIGEDLENTCKNINESFACVKEYIEKCNGTQECKKSCQELIKPMQSFLNNTGLRNLEEELCDANSNLRQLYLISYECLEKNSDAYSACHKESEMSKKHLSELGNDTAKCCYFSWYHNCFSNITKEHCDKNATEYVKSGLLKLGHSAQKLCMTTDIICSSPPLHSDEVGHKKPDEVGHKEPDSVGHKEADEIGHNELDKVVRNETDKVRHKETDIVGSKETDKVGHKKPEKEKKNENKRETNSASIISCPIAETVFASYFILFMNLLIM